jgi:hypothetical protein
MQADLDRFSRGFERDVYCYSKEPSGLGAKGESAATAFFLFFGLLMSTMEEFGGVG